MLNYFTCPDKANTEIDKCLSQCRMDSRCMTIPTLKAISKERVWSGTPSTTQLINGTMIEYLKITKPYAVDPQDRAFMLLGISHHQLMAENAELAEIALGGAITSTVDLIEITKTNGSELEITDYKTWGSYRVAKALGIIKTGPKIFTVNPTKIDMRDTELQLNHYRLQLESRGFIVTKLWLQMTVRDGSTFMAESRGLFKNIYLIQVPMLDDLTIRDYFESKKAALIYAINTNTMPSVCSEEECWGGRRCKEYCEVAEHCPSPRGQMERKSK